MFREVRQRQVRPQRLVLHVRPFVRERQACRCQNVEFLSLLLVGGTGLSPGRSEVDLSLGNLSVRDSEADEGSIQNGASQARQGMQWWQAEGGEMRHRGSNSDHLDGVCAGCPFGRAKCPRSKIADPKAACHRADIPRGCEPN